MKCKWCESEGRFGDRHIRLFYAKNGGDFYACDKCLIEHGREDDYDVPSPYNDLLIELGV